MALSDFLRTVSALLRPKPVLTEPAVSDAVVVDAAPSAPTFEAPVASAVVITADKLRAMGASNADTFAPLLVKYMEPAGILATKRRACMFLANALTETGGFKSLVENLNYSAASLRVMWPTRFDAETAERCGRNAQHAADQVAIANIAYGGRMGNVAPGSGWRYRGRGLMQTTGHDNYAVVQSKTGLPALERPELLEQPEPAVQAACIYWDTARCNDLADAGDLAAVRRRINGGANGLDEVRGWYDRAMRVL